MARGRSYTDEQLSHAIRRSVSWRGVMRELGLVATSAGAMRSVRSHADRLGLSYSHFRGQRGWTESQLRAAVAHAECWQEVVERLGPGGSTTVAGIKGHAARLALDTSHLVEPLTPVVRGPNVTPDMTHLDRAGPLLAAAWFTLCGHQVSWPMEPARYDLLNDTGQEIRRVQVKTTTARAGSSWKVYLSTTSGGRRSYDPAEIDDFFVIDGDLNYYLIPLPAVGGLQAVHLSAYSQYMLARADLVRDEHVRQHAGSE